MTAIAKRISYLTHARRGKPITSAKKHIKYVEANRMKKDGEPVHRNIPSLFNSEQNKIDRKDIYKILDNQPKQGVVMHKFVFSISEDERNRGQINLEELVRESMERYQTTLNRQFTWFAAVHDDKGHPHAHVLILGRDKERKEVGLFKGHLKKLNQIVEKSRERQEERNLDRGLIRNEFDLLRELDAERELSLTQEKINTNEREMSR